MEIQSRILYEDPHLLVCHKPAGLAVQNARIGCMDLESAVKNLLAARNPGALPYLGVIHRLDQPVEGLVLFAKTKSAAKGLHAQLTSGQIEKYYVAISTHRPPQSCGDLTDWLVKEPGKNFSRVVPKDFAGAKKAHLSYRVLKEATEGFLLEIRLYTGRHHQIRVQMAHAGMPLIGDRKYNTEADSVPALGLCAYKLRLRHPITQKELHFCIFPEGPAFARWKNLPI